MEYLFFKIRSGYFIQIKDGSVQQFIPFYNVSFNEGIAVNFMEVYAKEKIDLIETSNNLASSFNDEVANEVVYRLNFEDKNQLHGLPKDVIDQASALAESEDHPGKWLFKPTRASMYPFLTYSTERGLREKLYNSYVKRGDNNNDRDNKNIAIEMSTLRIERANLLGYSTHADFVLENNMAKNTKRVNELLNKVWEPAL